jgi:lysozyme
MTDISKVSQKGLDLIKSFEGWSARAYLCPAGVLTIGYGSTGKHVTLGMVITRERGEALLRADLARFEGEVTKTILVDVTQNQYDAMVSLCYNIGGAGFRKSSVASMTNARNFVEAAKRFSLWNKGGGKVLQGLVNRRAAEARLYVS